MRRQISALALLATLLSTLVATPLLARSLAGVDLPDTVEVAGKTLRLNGLGIRTKMFIKVYVGGLYLERITSRGEDVLRADQTQRMVLHFIYDGVEKQKLIDAWNEGFAANSAAELPALKERIATFNGWMEDVKRGDRIAVTWIPGQGTEVSVRGKVAGTIDGQDFARALFAIWLGPKPAHAGLKDGMLGR